MGPDGWHLHDDRRQRRPRQGAPTARRRPSSAAGASSAASPTGRSWRTSPSGCGTPGATSRSTTSSTSSTPTTTTRGRPASPAAASCTSSRAATTAGGSARGPAAASPTSTAPPGTAAGPAGSAGSPRPAGAPRPGLCVLNSAAFPPSTRNLLVYPDVFRKLVRAYKLKPAGATYAVDRGVRAARLRRGPLPPRRRRDRPRRGPLHPRLADRLRRRRAALGQRQDRADLPDDLGRAPTRSPRCRPCRPIGSSSWRGRRGRPRRRRSADPDYGAGDGASLELIRTGRVEPARAALCDGSSPTRIARPASERHALAVLSACVDAPEWRSAASVEASRDRRPGRCDGWRLESAPAGSLPEDLGMPGPTRAAHRRASPARGPARTLQVCRAERLLMLGSPRRGKQNRRSSARRGPGEPPVRGSTPCIAEDDHRDMNAEHPARRGRDPPGRRPLPPRRLSPAASKGSDPARPATSIAGEHRSRATTRSVAAAALFALQGWRRSRRRRRPARPRRPRPTTIPRRRPRRPLPRPPRAGRRPSRPTPIADWLAKTPDGRPARAGPRRSASWRRCGKRAILAAGPDPARRCSATRTPTSAGPRWSWPTSSARPRRRPPWWRSRRTGDRPVDERRLALAAASRGYDGQGARPACSPTCPPGRRPRAPQRGPAHPGAAGLRRRRRPRPRGARRRRPGPSPGGHRAARPEGRHRPGGRPEVQRRQAAEGRPRACPRRGAGRTPPPS